MSDRISGERILIAQAPSSPPSTDRDFGGYDGGTCAGTPQLSAGTNRTVGPFSLKGVDKETLAMLKAEKEAEKQAEQWAGLCEQDLRKPGSSPQLAPGFDGLLMSSAGLPDREIAYGMIQHPELADSDEKLLLNGGTKYAQQNYANQLKCYEREFTKPVTDKSFTKTEQEEIFYDKLGKAHEIALRESGFAYDRTGKADVDCLQQLGLIDEKLGLGAKDSKDKNTWLGMARYNLKGVMLQNAKDGIETADTKAYSLAQLSRVDRELGHNGTADRELSQALKMQTSPDAANYLKGVIANPKTFWSTVDRLNFPPDAEMHRENTKLGLQSSGAPSYYSSQSLDNWHERHPGQLLPGQLPPGTNETVGPLSDK